MHTTDAMVHSRLARRMLAGTAAGAAGTTALNAVTYLDMAVRARPASGTPGQAVERLADKASVPIPGDEERRGNRVSGLGPLLGIASGVAVGTLLGAASGTRTRYGTALTAVALTLAAMAASDASLAALEVTDPRTWSAKDWLADAVPHAAYGLTAAVVLCRLNHP
ncbi:hypothetical protein [Kitasatospora sp. NPDC098663]|uniref:hypothetical protein n=1 Tax=Kitasatospora sp. NPDC098663 TaxID=3364096 RepID=UPI00380FEA66